MLTRFSVSCASNPYIDLKQPGKYTMANIDELSRKYSDLERKHSALESEHYNLKNRTSHLERKHLELKREIESIKSKIAIIHNTPLPLSPGPDAA
jgi:chromosome segregation ATPase